jgi:hypothetical protein
MKWHLYQVQLAAERKCWTFELTRNNDQDAAELAGEYLTKNNISNGPFQVLAYCRIGFSNEPTLILTSKE